MSKLVALRPGKPVKKMINDVMLGKDEGADPSASNNEDSSNTQQRLSGIAGRVSSDFHSKTYELTHLMKVSLYLKSFVSFQGSVTGRKPRPVRPGMFLETVSKVLFYVL